MDRNVINLKERRREAEARVRRHAREEMAAARRLEGPGAAERLGALKGRFRDVSRQRDAHERPPPVRLAWGLLLAGAALLWLVRPH